MGLKEYYLIAKDNAVDFNIRIKEVVSIGYEPVGELNSNLAITSVKDSGRYSESVSKELYSILMVRDLEGDE